MRDQAALRCLFYASSWSFELAFCADILFGLIGFVCLVGLCLDYSTMHKLHNRFRVHNHSCHTMILSVMGPKSLWEGSWLKVREPK